jgi:hypothetical protein
LWTVTWLESRGSSTARAGRQRAGGLRRTYGRVLDRRGALVTIASLLTGKKAAYSEPNGDYTPGCWLGLDGNSIDPANGFVRINDAGCGYASGTSYICSDNAK